MPCFDVGKSGTCGLSETINRLSRLPIFAEALADAVFDPFAFRIAGSMTSISFIERQIGIAIGEHHCQAGLSSCRRALQLVTANGCVRISNNHRVATCALSAVMFLKLHHAPPAVAATAADSKMMLSVFLESAGMFYPKGVQSQNRSKE